jgi:protein-tyrosine-phosphatase
MLLPEKIFRIESCGLDVDQSLHSPPEAVRIAATFGLNLGIHLSKRLADTDLHNADLIIPMEYQQYNRLLTMFPDYKSKIWLLNDFALWPANILCNIYDPFGQEDSEFRRCFRRMKRALDGLKNTICFHKVDNG